MDPPNLDKESILRQFDALRDAKKLLWNPPTAIEHIVDNSFQFEFRVCPSQKTKPAFPEDSSGESKHTCSISSTYQTSNGHNDTVQPMPEDPVPGLEDQSHSDIDPGTSEWHIAHVNNTHRLIFNKYCIYRPQYILLTRDPLKRQTSPLSLTDFQAAYATLEALKSPHYVIFNCGKAAGGSRMHKHLQIFERDPEALLPDKILRELQAKCTIPFRYFLSSFEHMQASHCDSLAAAAQEAYHEHVQQCAASLNTNANANDIVCHNIILTKSWLMTIPRRQAGVDAATANAAGFMGLVWVPDQSVVDLWKKLGPVRVLEELGVPSYEPQSNLHDLH